MSALPNPVERGPHAFETVVYAAPNLDYSTSPDLQQYWIYQQPATSYSTRSVDLSLFAEFDFRVSWPFTNAEVPINGIASIPSGNGPFPVVLFAHGNHDPLEHSTPGYRYLCELLASHGIIAATIDVNFLNGRNRGENDGRAIIHLEHAKQFLIWNETGGHPLQGKIKPDRFMIVGHSRGGEAVGHASVFNRLAQVQPDASSPPVPLDGSGGLGPYNIPLQALVAIAPTDRQYVPLNGPSRALDNYVVLHGSRDGDVFNFPGYLTFDRSHSVDLEHPTDPAAGFKALLWIYGANHNFFNSVWAQESSDTISRVDQEQIAKAYVSTIAQVVLLDRLEYLDLLKDHTCGATAGWLPDGITFVSQYQDRDRAYLQHFEELDAMLAVSAPFTGGVHIEGVTAEKLQFNLGATQHLFQETHGLRLTWNGRGGQYRINFQPKAVDTGRFSVLALRVGQSFEQQNAAEQDQDFTLQFEDGVTTVSIAISSVNRLVYPAPGLDTESKTVLQTFRVPIQQLQSAGLDTAHLTAISLIFDRVATGRIYLDDLHLSH